MITLLNGTAEAVLPGLSADSFDALVTDPPAGIGFMGKPWDGDKGGRDQWIAWLAGIMREVLRVLKPGAYGLVWALPRTSHWPATALENAGFEIRDIHHHLFGTGFPKSLNLGDGRGTALKPAAEHWILVRKPLTGTVASNVQEYGTGALNIDACRIGDSGATKRGSQAAYPRNADGTEDRSVHWARTGHAIVPVSGGRWPAHVSLDEEAAAVLDEQAGERRSAGLHPSAAVCDENRRAYGDGLKQGPLYADRGGASRFFYVAKPSKRERGEGNNHPTVKSLALMDWLIRLITPPGGTILDPFAGSGTTLLAADAGGWSAVGIEQHEAYAALAGARIEATL